MKVFEVLAEWQKARSRMGSNIGFVPTMGALHAGHLELVRRSQKENQLTVVSIFVNPSQFNQAEDLANYPRTLEQDLSLLKEAGVDAVILPTAAEIYADDYRFRLSEHAESLLHEGRERPGHFEGVLTVVLKLFNLVRPQRTYFGEKDFQQLRLIRSMAEALFLPIEVIGVATVRDERGLALSSRNSRLSDQEKIHASHLQRVLKNSANVAEAEAELSQLGFAVEYVVDEKAWQRRLAAVRLGKTRLIDNVPL